MVKHFLSPMTSTRGWKEYVFLRVSILGIGTLMKDSIILETSFLYFKTNKISRKYFKIFERYENETVVFCIDAKNIYIICAKIQLGIQNCFKINYYTQMLVTSKIFKFQF